MTRRLAILVQHLVVGGMGLALAIAVFAGTSPSIASAHAPAIGVVEFDQPLLAQPTADAEILASLAAGGEVELTGAASGPYVEVSVDGLIGWVAVDLIHAGQITTAITNQVTPLTAAPDDDGAVVRVIPPGDTVILTGAAVETWLAGSYDGNGGWLPAANVDR